MEQQALEDAAVDGRLIILPCKVGDTVYVISEDRITKREVYYVITGSLGTTCACVNMRENVKQYDASLNMFGKTVFLTRAEAEAAFRLKD